MNTFKKIVIITYCLVSQFLCYASAHQDNSSHQSLISNIFVFIGRDGQEESGPEVSIFQVL